MYKIIFEKNREQRENQAMKINNNKYESSWSPPPCLKVQLQRTVGGGGGGVSSMTDLTLLLYRIDTTIGPPPSSPLPILLT